MASNEGDAKSGGRVRVFLGISLDGRIAGPGDALDWLDVGPGAEDTFSPFLASVGAMLMGRNTFDVVQAMGVPWPYGELPVVVATRRPLGAHPATVQAASAEVGELVALALELAQGRDVYLDGGQLVREALDAGLVHELCLTVVPVLLGPGKGLFEGLLGRTRLALRDSRAIGAGLVQLRYRVLPDESA